MQSEVCQLKSVHTVIYECTTWDKYLYQKWQKFLEISENSLQFLSMSKFGEVGAGNCTAVAEVEFLGNEGHSSVIKFPPECTCKKSFLMLNCCLMNATSSMNDS